jgi:peptidoglycan/xylan/chitin deacetylase (PgdA/CDA1 family)
MTLYIAAYDTETPDCLPACRKIVEMHRRYEMPATFFVVGQMLENNPAEYRELLDDPLFEVASHTYSHKMLRDQPFCAPAEPDPEVRRQILLGKEWVETVFERPCVGMRPGCGFDNGFSEALLVLSTCREAGYRYVSSLLWGPDFSLPIPLNPPHSYEPDGYPDIWELPGHGWHDNLLKNNNQWGPRRIISFPPVLPEIIPPDFLETPAEEFAIYRLVIDRACEIDLPHVSLVWHPWSLDLFDPEMVMLDMTFQYVRDQGMEAGTYAELADRCARSASGDEA